MEGSINKKAEEGMTRLMRRVEALKDRLVARSFRHAAKPDSMRVSWPAVPGAYQVGNPHDPVAICTLSSNRLFPALARRPGVAIAGRVYSANLGIEKMVANVAANPSIRFLLVCGKESPYFQVGQALQSLFVQGLTSQGRIIGASGHMPELGQIDLAIIERFRKQVELVDYTGELDSDKLACAAEELAVQNPGPYHDIPLKSKALPPVDGNGFRLVRLGGHRQPFAYDPMGFFIISIDQAAGEILVHHYWSDHSPAHFVRGRNGEAILLALLREQLISQKGHAGYLGAELAKAETAMRLGLHYEQDRPLQ